MNDIHYSFLDIWQKLQVNNIHNIYEQYYLIEDILISKEEKIWEEADRIVLFFPLTLFSIPYFLQRYLEQIDKRLRSLIHPEDPNLKPKELLIIALASEEQEEYSLNGRYHTTVHQLLKPLQIWATDLKIKYLVPHIVYDYQKYQTNLNYIKEIATMTLIENLPYIKFVEEADNDIIKYIEKIVQE